MHNYYEDLLKRIDEAPVWFDEFGVPRYDLFSPRHLGNIYAREAALAEVSCQSCGRRFHVALTDVFARKGFALSDEIRLRRVHYGDPPNIHCCEAGPTMNSVMHEVLEYWTRDYEVASDWQRGPTFEGLITWPSLDPQDTVAEVLAAIQAGAKTLLVMCTSRQNRYHLAGQVSAAMLGEGRVLVGFHTTYAVVARSMLDSLVPIADIGRPWEGERKVTLSSFSNLTDIDVATIKTVVILAGPAPRNETEQKSWNDTADRLAIKLSDKVRIEFALPHSHRMITNPDQTIDAGRIRQN
jgi:hypothetical protein